MLKAILIDIDNTLLSFDGYVQEAMEEGFARFSLPAYGPEMFPVFTRINNGLWQRIERGEMTVADLRSVRWNTIFAELGIAGDGPAFEDYFKAKLFESAIPMPGAMELLEALSGRFVLCTASNGPVKQQRNRLVLGRMLPYMDRLFLSEEIGVSKPDPAFFRVCLERLAVTCGCPVAPGEVLMLGDSLTSDMAGGIASGLVTCLYDPMGAYAPGPGVPSPDCVVRDLADVPGLPCLTDLPKRN